jgi:drug/metabolite transporter (DMT)-like permease
MLLAVSATFITAAAQILIKTGSGHIGERATLMDTLISLITVPQLFAGYALYGVVTVIMVLALRHGELSVIWPIISLSFVWVAILSVLIFHEEMNWEKIGGIAVIITGVAIMGMGGGKGSPR